MLKSEVVNVTEMVTIETTSVGTISDESSTLNSSIDHLDSSSTQLMSATREHNPMDESLQNNTGKNNKMHVSAMPTIEHMMHHMNATNNTSVETSKTDNRQGRLIISKRNIDKFSNHFTS